MIAGTTPITISQAVREGAERLATVADNPRLDSRLLLAHALGCDRSDLIRDPQRLIDPTVFRHLLARRERAEPIAHIVGRREFWSLSFEVSPATLVPRPDTETLVEDALAAFARRPAPTRILDLGTGTGCLLLALLHEFPDAWGVGVDLEPRASALAQRNSARLGLAARAAFITGDWTAPLAGRFDLIVSNPPYIPTPDMAALMPDVVQYEPRRALAAGPDGGDAYRRVIPALRESLAPNGVAILELGAGQANMVAEIARPDGFCITFRQDLAGIPRVIRLSAALD
ncbi:peptide chain release factor N(5)-glutamine methyltransferase [Rhodopila sp.]|uniref:peptide chain release factor N(5)-glutamine methyltransferase n=1 Tax=Rhodopila sp. TaxID=2480087 RepID=UPI002BE0E719|nr:peptide chain release factor N(5)-glutamine methyltransferase [Rhodopila sp.]HVZ07468.1 peptide chain release factor N(5)-glutamine methyltransferase [Rhodopila sp.]